MKISEVERRRYRQLLIVVLLAAVLMYAMHALGLYSPADSQAVPYTDLRTPTVPTAMSTVPVYAPGVMTVPTTSAIVGVPRHEAPPVITGTDCSAKPWDADCREPMETSAELAATTNALLSHGEPVETSAENAATINAMLGDNPTPGPWGRQPNPWDTPDALDRLP